MEAAQGIGDRVLTPEGAVAVPQDGVAPNGVDAQHDAHHAGHLPAQQLHQLRLVGQALPVHQQANEALTPGVGTDIQVPQQAAAGVLVIAGHGELPDILPQHRGRLVSGAHLDETAVDIRHLVGPGSVEAHAAIGSDRILALVAVALRPLGTEDLLHRHVAAAQAPESVLDPLTLGPKLLGIVHVAEVAASTSAVVGAVRLGAMG